ncbi:response regulator [Aquipuribacter hungaricus]|uniref:Response regulator transcription factor n=1 Tax=Aquipuribacter hungaricus TaxID=545624 RepID=A0ABV7WL62_9MICO
MTAPAAPSPPDAGAAAVRVLVVDDNAVVRSGVVALLGLSPGIEVVGEASNGQQACTLLPRLAPDVVLLDVNMPVMDGVTAAGRISPTAAVLMTTFDDTSDRVRAALAAGARGYLVHGSFDADELVASVLAVHRGSGVFSAAAMTALSAPAAPVHAHRDVYDLSERQREVMDLIARGLGNREIATTLFLSEKTVKNHVNHIFARLGVTTRSQAVALWLDGPA